MSKINEAAMEAAHAYLASKAGAYLCCQQVATHFGWTSAHTARILLALSQCQRIMISLHKRDRTYYVPSKDQAASASPAHTPVITPPLKVDKYRIALYRELAEARAAIRSIG